MNQYVTGAIIKKLREKQNLTQLQLGEKLNVSDKTISKWETGRGFPDISLLEALSKALNISTIELLSGEDIINTNRSSNMKRLKFYVCPVCGNVILSIGETVVSCCGINLPPLEAENADENHKISVTKVEDEYYVEIPHEMNKEHYISFIASVKYDGWEICKLYPEETPDTRFKIWGTHCIYYYCNKHGLYKVSL